VFLEVLNKALQHLSYCDCASRDEHDTDGCHRCILQSRHRRDRAGLSRTAAIRLLTAILENADKLEQVERISDIDIHPLIKSELEKAFLESLRAVPGAHLEARIVRGKPGYLWRRDDAAWEIELQAPVPSGPRIEAPSVPDFVFYPVRPDTSRPVAVFLDGFAFHADEASGHNRVALDVLQRQSLLRSGEYWTWSFSWEDIQFRNEPAKIPATLWGEENATRRNEQLAPKVLSGEDLGLARSAGEYTNWSLFLEFLARPSAAFWATLSYLYGLALPSQLRPIRRDEAADAVRQFMQFETPPSLPETAPVDGVGGIYGLLPQQLASITITSLQGAKDRNPAEVFLLLRFDDDATSRDPDFPKHWRGLLRLMNRVQFLPNFFMITARGWRQGFFAGIPDAYAYYLAGGVPSQPEGRAAAGKVADQGFDMNLVRPAIRSALERVIGAGLPKPMLGFELMESGMIVGTAEAAWPDRLVAVMSDDAPDESESFRRAGWTVLPFGVAGIAAEAIESLMSHLRSQP
jgi:DEAD/DEAH box helicase domain-containing protein